MPEPDEAAAIQLLTQKLEAVQQKMDELDKTTRHGKWMGRFLVIAIALGAIASLWRTFAAIQSIPPQLYARYAVEEAEYLRPIFLNNAEKVLKNIEPVYTQAFTKEFEQAMPKIAELGNAEMDKFMLNIGQGLENRLSKAVQDIVSAHLKALSKDVPELKDPAKQTKVLDKAQDVYYSAAQEVAKEVFSEQTTALANLGATLETFEVPPEIKKMSDEKLIEHTKNSLLDVLALRLSFVDEATTPIVARASQKAGR